MKVVLDTSAVVAWYVEQPTSAAARRWRDDARTGRVEVVEPALHFVEFANVLRTYVRRREIERRVAETIWEAHLDMPFVLHEPARESILTTALTYDSSVYDAIFIQTALECEALLVTAERRTTGWVTRLGSQALSLS